MNPPQPSNKAMDVTKGLRPYIEAQRREKDIPNMAEWFQWLAEQLEKHGRPEKALGTHIAFKDWTP